MVSESKVTLHCNLQELNVMQVILLRHALRMKKKPTHRKAMENVWPIILKKTYASCKLQKNLHINGKEIFVLLQEKVFLQSTNFPLPLIKMLCAVYYDLSPLTLIMFAKGFDCPMNFTHKEQ